MKTQLLTLGLASLANIAMADEQKPNILWYVIEDMSPDFLAMYNDGNGAKLPNIEALAKKGTIYNSAYSNAPVSSAARTTLITGCYGPRIGGSLHRHLELTTLPDGLRMFPSYLREAGYYTTNSAKTDYNVVLDTTAWDQIKGKQGAWRGRASKNTPFFHMQTNAVTHESSLLFDEKIYKTIKTETDPNDVFLMPYHPDTKLMRYTYATLYDKLAKADQVFGSIVDMLKKDGVFDNTIIFFFGDNGGCLPGTKGYTDNVGLNVPLMVYMPEKWREKFNMPQGGVVDTPVAFMDFAPTVLALAGVKTPKQMDGEVFIGKKLDKNRSVFCYGDRFDDLYAFNRVVRKGHFRYARNFQPYHSQSLHSYYRYKSLAFNEWRDMFHEGLLNKYQSSFFQVFGVEELYDLSKDPKELNNLANNPEYKNIVEDMRKDLFEYMVKTGDVGLYPETVFLKEGIKNAAKFSSENAQNMKHYLKIANMQLSKYGDVSNELLKELNSGDMVARWWALTTLCYFANEAKGNLSGIENMVNSDGPCYLRARAIVLKALIGDKLDSKILVDLLTQSTTLAETLLVLNDYAFLKEKGLLPKVEFKNPPFTSDSVEQRLLLLNQ